MMLLSLSLHQQLKNSLSLLQKSLDRGWAEFQMTEKFSIVKQLYQQIYWWYESEYYNFIPNPAHWYASQVIGRHFLAEVGKLGIYFDAVLPGDFAESTELVREDGLNVRRFKITAFHQGEPLCVFQLDYIHEHEKFFFVAPPQLTIVDFSEMDGICHPY